MSARFLGTTLVMAAACLHAQSWHDAKPPSSVAQQLASIEKQKDALRKAGWPIMAESRALPVQVAAIAEVQPVAPPPPAPAESECRQLSPGTTAALAQSAGEREGVDPKLILAVMKQESGFNPCAISPKGALGLMQLMPTTADDLFVTNPFDPVQNVYGGAHFLRQLLDRYLNNTSLALSAYNAGPARVTNAVPDIPETKAYVQAITRAIGDIQPLTDSTRADE